MMANFGNNTDRSIARAELSQSDIGLAGEILILTGPPGSGKTTTAKSLSEQPGPPKVHLHSDDFWHFIKHGSIAPYLPEAHEQNKMVVDILAKVAAGYAMGGYFVVVDGIIGPWFLHSFKMLAVPLHYIVLRPPLEVAIQRCQERGGDSLTDPGPITMLYQQLASLGELERHVLPTEGFSKEEMLNEVAAALHNAQFRLSL